jgi:hypothetical protein
VKTRSKSRIPNFRTRPRLGTPEFLQSFGFKDKRSYINSKTGRVVLRGLDYKEFWDEIYGRAGGRCEVETDGKRCNKFVSRDGLNRGELRHLNHRGKGGSDVPENVELSCGGHESCHRKLDHVGPQWTKTESVA